jgi:hypothetical protein
MRLHRFDTEGVKKTKNAGVGFQVPGVGKEDLTLTTNTYE